jgi:hypothetical protein
MIKVTHTCGSLADITSTHRRSEVTTLFVGDEFHMTIKQWDKLKDLILKQQQDKAIQWFMKKFDIEEPIAVFTVKRVEISLLIGSVR